MHTSLLSFPNELLQDILQLASPYIQNDNLIGGSAVSLDRQSSIMPSLRLTCKRFNNAIVPLMYSHTFIRHNYLKDDEFAECLESLAVGTHAAVYYATKITVFAPGPPLEMEKLGDENEKKLKLEMIERVKKLLPVAISKFECATTVRWWIFDPDYDWSIDYVVSGISKMPSLTALEISIHSTETDSFRIDSIPPLEEFWIRDDSGQDVLERGRVQGIPELIAKSSTCLRQLGLETCILYDRDPLLLDPYLHLTSPLHITHLILMGYFVELNSAILPHLRYLSSIWIENYADARTRARRSAEQYGEPHHQEPGVVTVDDIWKGLNREKIHLTKIDVDELPESLFHYLDSYTGLSSLSIGDAMWVPEAQSSRAARAIYSSALRNHVSSLERLSILSQPDSEWAFGDHSVSAILSLVNLKYLCMTVDYNLRDDLPDRDDYEDVNVPFPIAYYDPNNSATRLIKTASFLPRLETLYIAGDDSVYRNFDGKSVNISGDKILHSQITSLGLLDPAKYTFIIETFQRRYMLQKCGGNFHYTCF